VTARRSVGNRLAVTLAVGLAAVLVALVVATYGLAGRQLVAQLDARLQDQARAMAADVDPDDAEDPIELADDLWGDDAPDAVQAQLLTADGRVAASTGAVPGGGAPLADADVVSAVLAGQSGRGTVERDGEAFRIHVRRVPGTSLALVVAADLDVVTQPQQTLLAVLVPVGLAGLAALVAVAVVATRRALRPLEDMAAQAGQVGGDDLGVRLATTGRGDELDRLAQQVNRMLDRLADVIDRERRFTADASHELRMPLAILRAELELAETSADDRVAARLASAREELDRLTTLVDDLLVLARADADRLDAADRVDLGRLLAELRDRFDLVARTRHVDIEVAGTGTVTGDERALHRAVSNLVDNAVRHTPDGGRVRASVAIEGARAVVVVRDTGPGVPEDHLASIFTRFGRTDAARTRGGAGLGLAIVAAVAAAHGGEATARNHPDGGLEVTLRLQVVAASTSNAGSNVNGVTTRPHRR